MSLTPIALRLVLDTNLLVNAVLMGRSTPDQAFDHAVAHCVVLRSEETFEEFEAVLLRSKFDRYRTKEARIRVLSDFLDFAERVSTSERIQVCRHAKDDKFLELAVAGHADMIVTGDLDLLVLDPFRAVRIVTAAQFLNRMLA